MRRMFCLMLLVAGCHAHTVQGKQTTLETPPKEPQVSSERPVRTTPGGMLDPKAMHQVQHALSSHGVSAPSSGQLDDETQQALRQFQKREHMAQTGMPDYDTLRRLGLDPKKIYLGGAARASSKEPRQQSSEAHHSSDAQQPSSDAQQPSGGQQQK